MTPTLLTGKSTAKTCPVLAVEPGGAHLVEHDGIGFTQGFEPLPGHFARSRVRPGPGRGRDGARPSLPAGPALPTARTSSLKRIAQWLDQFEGHVLGQAADVVVGLDVRAACSWLRLALSMTSG